MIVLVCGGYWYIRNFLAFHTVFYKPELFFEFDMFPIRQPFLKLWKLWQDAGLGSLHGGFGLAFWGLALPAWFYTIIQVTVKKRDENERIFLWLVLPFLAGVGQLIMITLSALPRCPRYSLYIVALGLLALGRVLTAFDSVIFFKKTVQILSIISAGLAILQWSCHFARYPLGKASADFVRGRYTTESVYITQRPYGPAWALLDYLTIDDPQGLSFYVCMYSRPLTSPVYGTKLQNRVWNLQKDRAAFPDAFIYYYNLHRGPRGLLRYSDPKITISEVKATQKYELVLQGRGVRFFVRKDYLQRPGKRKKIEEFYQNNPLEDILLPGGSVK